MDTSEEKASAPEKQKALCVATRCSTVEQFVATFHRFCDESSFFVATLATRPVGLETAFSIQLDDKTPVLRGLCTVVEAWSTPANRFGRPGVRLHVKRLTNDSLAVFKSLQAARLAAESAAVIDAAARAADETNAQLQEAARAAEAAAVAALPTTVQVPSPRASIESPTSAALPTRDATTDATKAGGTAKQADAPLGTSAASPGATSSTSSAASPGATSSTSSAASPGATSPAESDAKQSDAKQSDAKQSDAAKPSPPPVPKGETLAERLRAAKAGTPLKPLGSPPPFKPKTDAIPAIPRIAPTAFAAKPLPHTPAINVELDEPTKIEAKMVRAEGTAPLSRSAIVKDLEAERSGDAGWTDDATANTAPPGAAPATTTLAASTASANVAASSVETPAASLAASTTSANATASSVATPASLAASTTSANAVACSVATPAVSAPSAPTATALSASTATTSAPSVTAPSTPPAPSAFAAATDSRPIARGSSSTLIGAPVRPTPPPGMTTPAIGISSSTLNLSNTPSPDEAPAMITSEPAPDEPAMITSLPPPGMAARDAAPVAVADDMTSPVASESRAPGSSFVLPANPLMNLSDKSLEGFIDCALYEETGNFFTAPGYDESLVDLDDIAPPPGALSPVHAIRPEGEHSTMAFLGTPSMAPPDMAPLAVVQQQQRTTIPPYAAQPVYPQYPTGPMQPLQYPQPQPYPPQYPTGQMPPLAYPAEQAPPVAPTNRRWLVIGGSAVAASALLLIAVLATRGEDATATAATPPPAPTVNVTPKEPAVEPKVVAEPAAVAAVEPPDDTEEAAAPAADPDALPSVGSGPCAMTVTTTPAGSMVRVDDQTMGPSPIVVKLPCKRARVDVKHARYAPGGKWVALAEGTPATVDIALSRPTHGVTIVTQPAGATISIAGRRAGTSPTRLQMMGFTKVALKIEKKGYKTVVESVYSKTDGERRTVTLTKIK